MLTTQNSARQKPLPYPSYTDENNVKDRGYYDDRDAQKHRYNDRTTSHQQPQERKPAPRQPSREEDDEYDRPYAGRGEYDRDYDRYYDRDRYHDRERDHDRNRYDQYDDREYEEVPKPRQQPQQQQLRGGYGDERPSRPAAMPLQHSRQQNDYNSRQPSTVSQQHSSSLPRSILKKQSKINDSYSSDTVISDQSGSRTRQLPPAPQASAGKPTGGSVARGGYDDEPQQQPRVPRPLPSYGNHQPEDRYWEEDVWDPQERRRQQAAPSLLNATGGAGPTARAQQVIQGDCEFCFERIRGKGVRNVHGQITCAHHTPEETDCEDCGSIVGLGQLGPDATRTQCSYCEEQGVTTNEQLLAIVNKVKADVEQKFGLPLTKMRVPLKFVTEDQLLDLSRLNPARVDNLFALAACTEATKAPPPPGQQDFQKYDIKRLCVLFGCGEQRLTAAVAYELTRAYMYTYQFPFRNPNFTPELQESLCQLVAHAYASLPENNGNPAYDWIAHTTAPNRNNGEFRATHQTYRKFVDSKQWNINNFLQYVRTNGCIPQELAVSGPTGF